MRISFTGTRKGMTPAQIYAVSRLLRQSKPVEVHHGDCVGADDEFAALCAVFPFPNEIIAHPGKSTGGPNEHPLRAHNPHNTKTLPVRPYFARNRDMVDLLVGEGDFLLACPGEMEWSSSGGTSYTAGYAKEKGKTVVTVWPDGTVG